MGNLLEYSGIVTKTRAMEAKLLTPAQFEEIASLHNVPEVVEYLKKETAYADILEELAPEQLHRGSIEKILTRSLYRDYAKLYRFCGQKQRKLMKLRQKPFDLDYKRPFFDRYSQISIEKLITSRTTDELIETLKDTEYYEPLKKLKDSPSVTLYDYDLALNLYYFTTLWKARKKVFKKEDKELYQRDCGTQIDLLNMQWIYRAKKYFNMKPADIYQLILPIHYRLSTDLIKGMVEATTLEELQTLCNQTPYARRYEFTEQLTMEQMYSECLHHLYTIDRRRNPYSIAAVNTYLFLKEEEIKKLTTALECIRYGLTPGETLAYVGGRTQ